MNRKFDYILNVSTKIDKYKLSNPIESRELLWPTNPKSYIYELYYDSVCIQFKDIPQTALALRPEHMQMTEFLDIVDDSRYFTAIRVYHKEKSATLSMENYMKVYHHIYQLTTRIADMNIYSNSFINEILKITSQSYIDTIKKLNLVSKHLEVALILGNEPCVKQ